MSASPEQNGTPPLRRRNLAMSNSCEALKLDMHAHATSSAHWVASPMRESASEEGGTMEINVEPCAPNNNHNCDARDLLPTQNPPTKNTMLHEAGKDAVAAETVWQQTSHKFCPPFLWVGQEAQHDNARQHEEELDLDGTPQQHRERMRMWSPLVSATEVWGPWLLRFLRRDKHTAWRVPDLPNFLDTDMFRPSLVGNGNTLHCQSVRAEQGKPGPIAPKMGAA